MCNNSYIKKLDKEWSIDALTDTEKNYFYEDRRFLPVLRGDYIIVLGRKGAGKSALFNKIISMQDETIFAESVTLANISLIAYDHYIRNPYAFWKFIIYVKLLKMIIRNQNFIIDNRKDLETLFPEVREFDTELYNWKLDSFIINILNFLKFNYTRDINNINEIEKKAELIERIVLDLLASNGSMQNDFSFYIVFDQLDISYQTVQDLNPGHPYHDLILGLLRAALDIKRITQRFYDRIFPIIFLRDDIYNNLYFPDKRKFSEKSWLIVWDYQSLRNLLSYRISRSNSQMGNDFKVAMSSIFDLSLNYEEVFKTIFQLSHYRPRDIITYVKNCCELVIENNIEKITIDIMKKAEANYVRCLVSDLTDELFPIIPKIEHLKFIGQLKNEFLFDEFKESFEKHQDDCKYFLGRNAYEVLKILFDYNIVGNLVYSETVPSERYKFMGNNIQIDIDMPFIVHIGLRQYFYYYAYSHTEIRERIMTWSPK